MIVVMKHGASSEQIDIVIKEINQFGYKDHPIYGVERTVIGAIGDEQSKWKLMDILAQLPGVDQVIPIMKPYKLTSHEVKQQRSVIAINKDVSIGGDNIVVMAGPCSVESEEQIHAAAQAVKTAGAKVLRGGAYKPRTSPYDFQGLGEEGLRMLRDAGRAYGMPIVTEVLREHDVDTVAKYADVLQIGARNMQNYGLLKAVGQLKKPVLLKRGLANTVKEFLMSAEYILSQGNYNVLLCERGIRTFETATRNTLDLGCVAVLRFETHLPVVVDPSHAAGQWSLVAPLARAGLAAGADSLIVEVHPNPHDALSDGAQSLTPKNFDALMESLVKIAEACGRTLIR
ncbi:MAG: 3-deoxy-7-phosphoheptulonate synthase [Candidatus Auribacter fodinae]|jgi:3-deoxy-7-phosphoheptulonate synthase|uniref:3-deoxy-7-phosphoheptulonate synthase n=1 Tax=Candidatus Auribacter fodinae TaxID=2093366 RepID=A0A3A4R2U4_9BACT|nr:MAG: 3-deoxy-7-phosphoheptulonate synthase [Candidatus Auribacter fodinae]